MAGMMTGGSSIPVGGGGPSSAGGSSQGGIHSGMNVSPYSKGLDMSNPVTLAIVAGVVVVAIVAFRRRR